MIAKATQKLPYLFHSSEEGSGEGRKKNERKFLGCWRAKRVRGASPRTPMRTQKYQATTRSTRCRLVTLLKVGSSFV